MQKKGSTSSTRKPSSTRKEMNNSTVYKKDEAELRLFVIQFLSNLQIFPVPTFEGKEEPLTEHEKERLEGLYECPRTPAQWWTNCRILVKELREYFVPHLIVYYMSFKRWPDGTKERPPVERFGRNYCHAILTRTFHGFPEVGDPFFVDEDRWWWLRYFVVMQEKFLFEFHWLLRATYEIDEAIVFPL